MRIKVLQLHKRDSCEFKFIQDKYAFNKELRTFAIADGTTQSFRSEIWAEILTQHFVNNPSFNPEELINEFEKCAVVYKNQNFTFSSNPAKASLQKAKRNKGGTATFIGIRVFEENKLHLIASGDSNAFIVDSKNNITPFPYADINSLDANNDFINTEKLLLQQITEKCFKRKVIDYNLNDRLVLTTDAISRLFLKKPEVLWELLRIETFDQLHEFCLKYWDRKELEEDDITVIIISFIGEDIRIIQPPLNFAFPKVNEVSFSPSVTDVIINKTEEMKIEEMRHQFNGIASDFQSVKRKLRLQNKLTIIVIILLIFNIMIACLVIPLWLKEKSSEESLKSEMQIKKSYDKKIHDLNIDNKTLREKVSEIQKISEETLAPNIPLQSEILESHSSSEEQVDQKDTILKMQNELREAGYDIHVDGIWGPKSSESWNEYQKNKTENR